MKRIVALAASALLFGAVALVMASAGKADLPGAAVSDQFASAIFGGDDEIARAHQQGDPMTGQMKCGDAYTDCGSGNCGMSTETAVGGVGNYDDANVKCATYMCGGMTKNCGTRVKTTCGS